MNGLRLPRAPDSGATRRTDMETSKTESPAAPFWKNDQVTIWHWDGLRTQFIPEGSVDLVLTSPPYYRCEHLWGGLWKALGITKEYINEQSKLKLTWNDPKLDFDDKRVRPDIDDQEAMDRFYVTELCLPYNPPPDERDVFAYYNDLGPLCGSAGYIRIRDGFVYGTMAVIRA